MPKVSIEVYQQKHGEWQADVPREVINKGEEAVKNYLYQNSIVDQALDYSSVNTEVTFIVEE